MRDELRAQYEAILAMAEEARQHCYDAQGNLAPLIRGEKRKDGTRPTVRNPYLIEYQRLMNLARHMARDLGIAAPEETTGSLVEATEGGSRVAQLEALLKKLAVELEACEGHGMAALAGVYLETQNALKEAMADEPDGGGIDAIVARKANPDKKRFSVV